MSESLSNDTSSPRKLYRGALFHAKNMETIEFIPDAALVVDETEGIILEAGNFEDVGQKFNNLPVIQLADHEVMIPGFIDLHVHLPQQAVTGHQAATLLEWLDTHIFRAEAKFADDGHAQRISNWFFRELLKNGTTTAVVFLTSHPSAAQIAFQTAETMGNRVVMGLNLMDKHAPDNLLIPAARALEETEALCRQWHDKAQGRIQYAWVPRFAITSTEDLLAGIGGLRKKYPDVYYHTHLSEQPSEVAAVKAQFPWAKDYTEVYERFGHLGPKTILAHAIHLDDSELDRIHTGDASLAHCPSSNFFLKSGRFRLFDIIKKNIRFGLGSDIGAGPEMCLFKVMKDAQYMQSDVLVPLANLFYMATLGAARALHQEDRLGSLEAGKQADFLILDGAGKSSIPSKLAVKSLKHDLAIDMLLSSMIYLGDDRLVAKTFVKGRCVYEKSV